MEKGYERVTVPDTINLVNMYRYTIYTKYKEKKAL